MKKILYTPAIALFIGGLFLISSCSKREVVHGGNPATPGNGDKSIEAKIRTIVSNLPHIKAGNSSAMRQGNGTTQAGGWDFSNPDNGYGYTTSNGVSYSASSNTFNLASNGGGGNGGTVVAGASSLDINYTFCFASGDEINGLDVFGTGAPSSGVSAVIGVSGDFSKLGANSNTEDLMDAFNGMAFYVVYDGKASGNYKVVDWTDPDLDLADIDGLDKMAFAFVIDFKGGRLFISSGGTVNVTRGTMNFNGKYFEVSGFLNDDGDFDLGGNLSYRLVTGFGAMSCN